MHKETTFLSQEHQHRYENLLIKDDTGNKDRERFALFYLISGNDDLYMKRKSIYDFSGHRIHLCLTDGEVDFSSGCESLIRLGFNLYNGYRDDDTSPMELLSRLDQDNQKLALNSMAVRFTIA